MGWPRKTSRRQSQGLKLLVGMHWGIQQRSQMKGSLKNQQKSWQAKEKAVTDPRKILSSTLELNPFITFLFVCQAIKLSNIWHLNTTKSSKISRISPLREINPTRLFWTYLYLEKGKYSKVPYRLNDTHTYTHTHVANEDGKHWEEGESAFLLQQFGNLHPFWLQSWWKTFHAPEQLQGITHPRNKDATLGVAWLLPGKHRIKHISSPHPWFKTYLSQKNGSWGNHSASVTVHTWTHMKVSYWSRPLVH